MNDTATRTGWRTLAEPTYGVTVFGEAMRAPAGTGVRPLTSGEVDGWELQVLGDPGTDIVLADDIEGNDVLYVTAAALRFEGER
jgi:hypothetical protein